MPRKLVIFGNGLGRALNNDHFNLTSAMRSVWISEDCLTPAQKDLIATAIEGVEIENGPENEEQLFGTQLALLACELLEKATNDETLGRWLTDDALGYPSALNKYTYEVARHFHNHDMELVFHDRWNRFINSFLAFVFRSKSHVATLNYDTLLYEPFNNSLEIDGAQIQLCNGFNGTLLDGYTHGLGFSAQNLERRFNPEQKAYYMHLHGSPLFVDDDGGTPRKLTRAQLQNEIGEKKSHIVLTHGAMKPVVISSSKVLEMYWSHLAEAIHEAEEIILFGYSGADRHLNNKIKKHREETPVRVVERTHDNQDGRSAYWSAKLGGNTKVTAFQNILDFENWD